MITRSDSGTIALGGRERKAIKEEQNPTVVMDDLKRKEMLACTGFRISEAQEKYQEDSQRGTPENGIYFFKDATPKSDHFVEFRVELPKKFNSTARNISLQVELVSLPPDSIDYSKAQVFPEQQHLKAITAASRVVQATTLAHSSSEHETNNTSGDPPVPMINTILRYRVEVGSYRQGDKRFAVKASIAPHNFELFPHLQDIQPCYTPPIYVASKVKRNHNIEHKRKQREADSVSLGSTGAATPKSEFQDDEQHFIDPSTAATAPEPHFSHQEDMSTPSLYPQGRHASMTRNLVAAQPLKRQRNDTFIQQVPDAPRPKRERQDQRTHQELAALDDRLAALEDTVNNLVVPSLRRIEARLNNSDLSFQHMLGNDSQDAEFVPPQPSLERANSEALFERYYNIHGLVHPLLSPATSNDVIDLNTTNSAHPPAVSNAQSLITSTPSIARTPSTSRWLETIPTMSHNNALTGLESSFAPSEQ